MHHLNDENKVIKIMDKRNKEMYCKIKYVACQQVLSEVIVELIRYKRHKGYRCILSLLNNDNLMK